LSAPAPASDVASATVYVDAPPGEAFRVFTEEIDLWWGQGPAYRIAGKRRGQLALEARVGGRLFETFTGGTGTHTVEVGRVLAWDPPGSLELEWRSVTFVPGEATHVAVRFEPKRDGTLVTVRHSGWSGIRADHPVRHGESAGVFLRRTGLWWGRLLTSLREHAAAGKRRA
jgi:uncharacterized protein YndB with AHSA1/START domain